MAKSKPVAPIEFDPRNANRGNRRGRQVVQESLEKYGAGRSILLDKKNRVIAGNKTGEAANKLDIPIRIVETDGSELIAVKRTDLDLAKDPKAIELGIADNRSSELGLTWDKQILDEMRQDEALDLSGMFTADELDKIIGEDGDPDKSNAYPEMELQPFEHYDYIVLTFRNSMDFLAACELFGVKRKKFTFEGIKSQKKDAKIGVARVVDGAGALKLVKGKVANGREREKRKARGTATGGPRSGDVSEVRAPLLAQDRPGD
jgi:hypothetical protein